MCLDREWQKLIEAYMAKAKAQIQYAGIAYMLNTNAEVSNTDPYATGPTAHNQWHEIGLHIMLLIPDLIQAILDFRNVAAVPVNRPRHSGKLARN